MSVEAGISENSDISDTTISDQSEPESDLETPAHGLELFGRFHSYLAGLRDEEFKQKLEERAKTGSKNLVLPICKTAMEHSFDKFISALSRSFLVAKQTPLSRTQAGSTEEFEEFAKRIGVKIDASVPEYCEEFGNILEIKRMVLTSVLKWLEVWKPPYHEGVNKKRLYKDIMKGIAHKAQSRRFNDAILLGLHTHKGSVFAYEDADWRGIMEEDLRKGRWEDGSNPTTRMYSGPRHTFVYTGPK
ncbi:hypothetical protein V5O48_012541 [Marasmius crinis-equi]|uniref:Uncharacterized protein n=1 Tax=Marasmius crinis-equi TaxID=585013 RepID=A0ABR3F2I8_9AGAR